MEIETIGLLPCLFLIDALGAQKRKILANLPISHDGNKPIHGGNVGTFLNGYDTNYNRNIIKH